MQEECEVKAAFLRTDHYEGVTEGGSFAHVRGVVSGLRELGTEVFFVSSGPLPGAVLGDELTRVQFPDHPRIFMEAAEMRYNIRFVREADKVFRRERPDFVYHRHSAFCLSSARLARRFRIPLMLEVNNLEVWLRSNWDVLRFAKLCEMMEAIAFDRADRLFVVSDVLRRQMIEFGVDPAKVVVNPNGVDPAVFRPEIDGSDVRRRLGFGDHVVAGFLGTFGVWHGTDVLARAAVKACAENPDLRVLMIGKGDLLPTVHDIVREGGIEDRVTFLGGVPHEEVPAHLAACDFLVSPHVPMEDGSEFFGSPTKLFEYMAMGKGIVASALGQIGEILEDGVSARLVTPGSVDELAAGLLELAAAPELGARLGEGARREVVEKYTWKSNAQRVLDAVQEVWDGRR